MILYCTTAPNDADLVRALGPTALAIPVPFGDVCFFGASDTGDPLRIVVERKRISDMANSVIGGRYLYQAQRAHEAGFDVLVLIVEGQMRPSPDDGSVEVPGWDAATGRKGWKQLVPAISYSRFDQYLTELDYIAGIMVKRSRDVRETAAMVKALWLNFQTPPSRHHSLRRIYTAPVDHALLVRPSLVRRVAKELDGIGWERSADVARRFPTVKAMADADVSDWESIPGVGKKVAMRAVSSIRGVAP